MIASTKPSRRTPAPPTPDSGRRPRRCARHPRAWMVTALAAVFLLLGTGSVFAGTLVAADSRRRRRCRRPGRRGGCAAQPHADPGPAAPGAGHPAAATALRTCSVAGLAKDPRLQRFEGAVINTGTGDGAVHQIGDQAGGPGQRAEGHHRRRGAGGARPRCPTDHEGVPGCGAGQHRAGRRRGPDAACRVEVRVRRSAVDPRPRRAGQGGVGGRTRTTRRSPRSSSTRPSGIRRTTGTPWGERALAEGDQTRVNSLMVDAGRLEPSRPASKRSATPVEDAGAAFVEALQLDAAPSVVIGTGSTGRADRPGALAAGEDADRADAAPLGQHARRNAGQDGLGHRRRRRHLGFVGHRHPEGARRVRDPDRGNHGEGRLGAEPRQRRAAGLRRRADEQGAGGQAEPRTSSTTALPVAGQTGTLATALRRSERRRPRHW